MPMIRYPLLPVAALLLTAATAQADDTMILWPPGWEVQSLPTVEGASGQPSVQLRQRAIKNDAAGEPSMVVELTRSQLVAGHEVNVQGVLMAMRKAVQVNFARSGLQSACTHVREVSLGGVPGMESTCTVTQNGVHVMTQTLVAAANARQAWSLSYAGSAEGYAANRQQVQQIRDGLKLDTAP
ncbi:DUF4946 domain-containing protein [Pseudomonas sp. 21LCFQ02]|uniref:DUF4946 domain-containing protein n=1 Tax=unclassified Pseudomonas TaxID=196821 RepID=UPI0005EE272D|nr:MULTISPECIES: DUF4946 domain-containing protein [unclassified Pseudomonas]MCO8168673.1 DUF4946 domain-containing protein [Pseudomonas sp. 21LCFQ02]MCQ9423055.1 DUF4946 domain-containing protein [Pseudomonas sp. LJDD11]